MIYIIDSSVYAGLRSLDMAISLLDKYNVEYKIITTFKSTGKYKDTYVNKLDPKIIKIILEISMYDLSVCCKYPKSSTLQSIRNKKPQPYRDFTSGKVFSLPLSEFITWLSEHPYFLKPFIIYDDVKEIAHLKFNNDDMKAFLPREYKKQKYKLSQLEALHKVGLDCSFDDVIEDFI